MTDLWLTATTAYIIVAAITMVPVLLPVLRKQNVVAKPSAFSDCSHFDENQTARLEAHYQRITGTLAFWKTNALAFKRFHFYVVVWTVPSSVLIPVLTQFITEKNSASIMVTVVSTFTAALVALHEALKVDEKFKAVRNSESGFYDLYRRMLDRPGSFGKTPDEQIDQYFAKVEVIRSSARSSETALASVGDAQA